MDAKQSVAIYEKNWYSDQSERTFLRKTNKWNLPKFGSENIYIMECSTHLKQYFSACLDIFYDKKILYKRHICILEY